MECNRYNVVKCVCSGGYGKPANREQHSEINTRNRSKAEYDQFEWVGRIMLSAEEIDMVMSAEQRGRKQNRYYNRGTGVDPKKILE